MIRAFIWGCVWVRANKMDGLNFLDAKSSLSKDADDAQVSPDDAKKDALRVPQ